MDPGFVVSMRHFVAGYAYRGQRQFEVPMSRLVKIRMMENFKEEPSGAYVLQQQALSTQTQQAQARAVILLADLKDAQDEFNQARGRAKGVAKSKMSTCEAQLHQLGLPMYHVELPDLNHLLELEGSELQLSCQTAIASLPRLQHATQRDKKKQVNRLRSLIEAEQKAAKTRIQPRWIQKCRECMGRSMQSFIVDDGNATWDVYKITSVMAGFAQDVFTQGIGLQDYYAKELLVIYTSHTIFMVEATISGCVLTGENLTGTARPKRPLSWRHHRA